MKQLLYFQKIWLYSYNYCTFVFFLFKNNINIFKHSVQIYLRKLQDAWQNIVYLFTVSKNKHLYNKIFYLVLIDLILLYIIYKLLYFIDLNAAEAVVNDQKVFQEIKSTEETDKAIKVATEKREEEAQHQEDLENQIVLQIVAIGLHVTFFTLLFVVKLYSASKS